MARTRDDGLSGCRRRTSPALADELYDLRPEVVAGVFGGRALPGDRHEVAGDLARVPLELVVGEAERRPADDGVLEVAPWARTWS